MRGMRFSSFFEKKLGKKLSENYIYWRLAELRGQTWGEIQKEICLKASHSPSLLLWEKVAAAMFAKQTCHGAKRSMLADG